MELLFFAKWKYCTGSITLTTVALFCHRPSYWCQGGDRGGGQVWAPREGENGLTSSLRAQGSHSSKPHPHPTAVAVTWKAWGLTSDRFHWIALTPSDSTLFNHRRHICKRKTPQILMQKCIAMVLHAQDFLHILPNYRKKVLPSLDLGL